YQNTKSNVLAALGVKIVCYFGLVSVSHVNAYVCATPMIGLCCTLGGEVSVSAGTSKSYVDSREADLIRRVKDGDKDAFYELVRPYERALYTSAMSIVNNQAGAEEASQEAVLKAFSNLARFRGESKFSTWLIQITINEARLKLRKDRRHLYESVDEPKSDDEGDYFPKDYADWREV